MSRLWWQGSTSLCIHPGGQVLKGWESIRASWESIFRNTDSLEIETEIIKAEIDPALAYVGGRAEIRVKKCKIDSKLLASPKFQKYQSVS